MLYTTDIEGAISEITEKHIKYVGVGQLINYSDGIKVVCENMLKVIPKGSYESP